MPVNPYESPKTPPELPLEAELAPVELGGTPTNVRYLVVGLSVSMSCLLYLDRFCIGAVTNVITSELSLNREEFGRAIAAFFWAYALAQVPAGYLAERLGSRLMLALYVVTWSLAVIGLGWSYGLLMFSLMRVVLGVAQAGAYPAAGSYLKQWVPLTGRARANSIVTTGGRLGLVLALMCTAPLMVLLGGLFGFSTGQWRLVFTLYGSLGLVWTIAFWFLFRDRPAEHPLCNDSERRLIAGGAGGPTELALSPLEQLKQLIPILADLNVWLLSLAGILVNFGWIFLVTWQSEYLKDKFGAQLGEAFGPFKDKASELAFQQTLLGVLPAITQFSAMAGGLSGGFIADILLRKMGRKWGRRTPGLIAGLAAAALYLLVPMLGNVWVFFAVMIATAFFVDLGLGSLWATYQDIGGSRVGSILGFANMWGNLGAAAFGWYFGYLAGNDNWSAVFYLSAVSLIGMSACWLFIDATRPVPGEGK